MEVRRTGGGWYPCGGPVRSVAALQATNTCLRSSTVWPSLPGAVGRGTCQRVRHSRSASRGGARLGQRRWGSCRACAVILSSPVDMTGGCLSGHRGPCPPFGWRAWCPRSVHPLLAASPCHRLSPSPSTLSQSDGPGVIRASSLCQRVRPCKPRLHPWALPCSHTLRCPHAVGTHPGSIAAASP